MASTNRNNPVDVIVAYLQARAERIKSLLPDHLPYKRFMHAVEAAIREETKLWVCAAQEKLLESLFQAVCQAAVTGLEPGRALDLAYFTPVYVKQQMVGAAFDTTYKGDLQLLYRSGSIRSIHAEVIREGDEYDLELGSNPSVRHRPALGLGKKRGEILAAYSVATLANGEKQVEIMVREELDQAQAKQRRLDKTKGPWAEWHGEMAKKSVLRRHMKKLPLSPEMMRLVIQDQSSEYSPPAGVALSVATGEEVDSLPAEPTDVAAAAGSAPPAPDETYEPPVNEESAADAGAMQKAAAESDGGAPAEAQPSQSAARSGVGSAKRSRGAATKAGGKTTSAQGSTSLITPAQVTLLSQKLKVKGLVDEAAIQFIKERTGKESIEALGVEEYREVLRAVSA